jgi:hypothetical protein
MCVLYHLQSILQVELLCLRYFTMNNLIMNYCVVNVMMITPLINDINKIIIVVVKVLAQDCNLKILAVIV